MKKRARAKDKGGVEGAEVGMKKGPVENGIR